MRLFCLLAILGACGCGPRQALTTWGYSHWYQRSGAESMEAFTEQRSRCLARAGAADDPAGVAPGSPEENAFVECMNGSGWCTSSYNCNKPGT